MEKPTEIGYSISQCFSSTRLSLSTCMTLSFARSPFSLPPYFDSWKVCVDVIVMHGADGSFRGVEHFQMAGRHCTEISSENIFDVAVA